MTSEVIMLNRKQLEYFIEAYRCRNIQVAANHLYISHQGLSRVIRSLEDALGETLFVRSNRGLEPTDYATALVPHVQILLDTYTRIDGLQTLAGQQKAVITVYTLDHMMSYPGTEFLLGFYERDPDITLSTVDTSDNRALDVLLGGKADFAIVNGPIDHTRFQSEALFFSRYCFRIHRDNPLASKALLSPSDLDGQQIIGKGREYNCFRRNVDEIINTYALRLDIPLELSDEELLMDLVEHNVAIAGTYEFSALNHCGPNTVIRYLDAPVSGQMIYLVERLNALPTRAGRCFKSYLLDWVKTHHLQQTV